MADPARSSRRMPALRIGAWRAGAAQTDEEARAYLQSRLAVFSKLVFWAFVALLVFLFAMYEAYPDVEPKNQEIIYGVGVIALGILALLWRALLVRKQLSVEALYTIDLVIMVGSGTTFGLVATLAHDLQASSYTCLIYQSFVVFTRALVVPSSARRTAITSALAFVPILAGAIVLTQLADDFEVPGPAFVAGDLVYNGVAVLLATTGSRIIYGLTKQRDEAMQLGQYTLDRKIGGGGMGVVWHAHHALLRRPTAVKLIHPERVGADTLDRFEREVQAMSQLTHPNTVAVFDYGRSPEGVLYYAMEYLPGINLEQLVQLDGPLPANRVVHILAQVCGALQEAHDAGIVHRDIKPANIILCRRGGQPDVAKVVDYGLVKDLTADTGQSSQVIVGTTHYIAPEAAVPSSTIGPAVDLYALGAVGYFLLTGKRVFAGKTPIEILVQHVTQPPKRPSDVATIDVPAELEDLLLRCLEKQPADRPASARELGEALDRIPRVGDWNRDTAARWWSAFEARAAKTLAVSSDAETLTIDLAART